MHTKGPWEFSDTAHTLVGANEARVRFYGEGITITLASPSDEERANYRLMVAAPELLEALTMIRDADEDCKRDGLPTIPPAARSTIDAAIRKAGKE